MHETMRPGFDDLSLAELRRRRSQKWVRHPADVLPAGVAEMDFPLAPPVKVALRAAVEADDCGYLDPRDTTLAEVFAGWAGRTLSWEVDPAGVVPTTDVMVGVAETLRRLTRPGDGVIITPPVYPPFFTTITEVGCRVVEAPLAEESGRWTLDLAAIERGFTAGAPVLLLCNPHNPTGRVLEEAELSAVAELAARYGATVLADEIHAPLVLDGTHRPFVALGGHAAERGITLTSASKGWNLAGLKCAVMVTAPGPMRELVSSLPEDARYRTGHLGALAAVSAWTDGEAWRSDLLGVLDRNRRLLAELLTEHLPEIGYTPPEATYLAWLDCRGLGLGSDPAAAFLQHGRVALEPGLNFGRQGAGYARLNIGTSAAVLIEAVHRMRRATDKARRTRTEP